MGPQPRPLLPGTTSDGSQSFVIWNASSELLRACLGTRPDTCSVLTGKGGKEGDEERKGTQEEREGGTQASTWISEWSIS